MKKKLARSLYEFFNQNIILTTFIGGLPAIWLAFIKIFEYKLTSNGHYFPSILILSTFFVVVPFIFILIKAIGDKYNFTATTNGSTIIFNLISAINSYKSYKSNRLIRNTNEIQPTYNRYCMSFKPEDNISELLEIMNKYLSTIFGLKNYQIGLSVLYNYKNKENDSDWKFIGTESIKNDLSKIELINNPDTTVYKIINGQKAYIFYADKQEALLNGQYVKSRNDNADVIGSILCYNFGTNDIIAVLSLATYEKRICEKGDKESENRLKDLIIETISNRILTEILIDAMNDKKICHSIKSKKIMA